MNTKLPMALSISRPQRSDGKRCINIEVMDEASRLRFLEIEIPLADMMAALTGLSHCSCVGDVRGLQWVGMHKVTESRSVICPLNSYKREELREWLECNCQEEGWILNTYLGSQESISTNPEGNGQVLRYSVTKYIAAEPTGEEAP